MFCSLYSSVNLKRLGEICCLHVVDIPHRLGDEIIPDPAVVTNTSQSWPNLGHAGGFLHLNIGEFFPQLALRAGSLQTVTSSERLGADYEGRSGIESAL